MVRGGISDATWCKGLGFEVYGLWFRVERLTVPGFGTRVSGFGFRDSRFGVRVSGFGFRVSGFGVRDSGFGFRVSGLRVRDLVSGFGFRDSGFGFRVWGLPARGDDDEVSFPL